MSRTSTMLLLTGDYADRLDALYAQAQDAERRAEKQADSASRRLDPKADNSAAAELERTRQEFNALRAEAEAEGMKVTLQAIGRKEWRAIKEKHPPRSGEGVDPEVVKQDRLAGVNADSVEDDLVYAAVIEPGFTSRAAFDEWVDELPEGDFQAILHRAWSMVNVARVDPKSLPVSPTPSGDASGK
jgi:hypothetical protein